MLKLLSRNLRLVESKLIISQMDGWIESQDFQLHRSLLSNERELVCKRQQWMRELEFRITRD